jgi:hypothetical protein
MAKKPKKHRKLAAPASERPPASVPRARVERPNGAWWFDFTFDRDHLALFRFAFFAVLAVDAFLQVHHAPRYGAGGFNVPHFAWLPLPIGREAVLAIDLGLAYLFTLAAFGVATRVVVPVAAALDAYYYFSSQLDSYQHHYLVVVLLIIASFVPWEAQDRRVRSWAMRLFCVQIAILYLWAAIAKLDPQWLDGTALKAQVSVKGARTMIERLGGYDTAAALVLVGELFLCVAWVWPRLWRYALPLGLAFHVGIELAGFQIGQFSYVMLAIYLLMLPSWLAAPPVKALRDRLRELPWPLWARIAALAAALLIGSVLLAASDVPVATWLRVVIALAGAGAFLLARGRVKVAVVHAIACAWIFVLAATTAQAVDYSRFWAGSARRLGSPAEMIEAYQQLLRIAPNHPSANYYLGSDDLAKGQHERAIARFRRTQAAEPAAARAWIGEARAWIAIGDRAKARDALQGALRADPASQEARDLLATLPE